MKRKRQQRKRPISQIIIHLVILVATFSIIVAADMSLEVKGALILVITLLAILVARYGEVIDDDGMRLD